MIRLQYHVQRFATFNVWLHQITLMSEVVLTSSLLPKALLPKVLFPRKVLVFPHLIVVGWEKYYVLSKLMIIMSPERFVLNISNINANTVITILEMSFALFCGIKILNSQFLPVDEFDEILNVFS